MQTYLPYADFAASARALDPRRLGRQRVEAPSMCRLVDRLERDGLVERRADPGDRRATRVHISAEGRRVAAEV